MSMPERNVVTCPNCGAKIEVTVWHTLNADVTPAAYRDLIDGTLFEYACPSCEKRIHLNYPMLLHDMQHKALVYLAQDDASLAYGRELLDMFHEKGMPGYRYRIVRKEMELIEKAMIFHADMDDRVIELIKDIQRENYQNEFFNLPETYFLINPDDPGDKHFLFFGFPQKSSTLPDEMYERGVFEFTAFCDDTYEGCLVVDRDWVTRFLEKNKARFGPGSDRKVSKVFS